ncbi:hypothetical protein SAMN05444157_3459 [Frankineae bacterium MT45]|nr:hypothetical protein SAMN05444157_3459 [Frankineae bacterium MT45]
MRRLRTRLLPLAPLLATVACASAAASTPHPPAHPTPVPNLTALSCSGATLGSNPILSAGETISVVVRGFAAHAAVSVRLIGRPQSQPQPAADTSGVVRVVYRIPAETSAGSHLLTLSGLPPLPAAKGINSGGDAGGMTISVVVPNVGFFHFSVNRSRSAPPCGQKPTVSS